uniref:hypothetical protein n=1 Tax=Burkholderia sp. M701 TaxID=326454 RepID=UPI001E2C7A3B|nr:hypothetical protein [Burkholderia sp. M701]
MKIKSEHLETLRTAITPLDTDGHRQVSIAANHSDMRYRWDLLRVARIDGMGGIAWTCAILYPYLNDEHIDTALRNIVPAFSA